MAMHQTIFLNSLLFLPVDESLQVALTGHKIDIQTPSTQIKRRTRVAGAHMYGLPQFVLTYAIYALFVGIGITTISPLWYQQAEQGLTRDQKVCHIFYIP